MALPIVAIVGRPNVGKSSLLNCIAQRRISIVDPTAGVTRDRVSAIVHVDDVYFEIVDTGGYGIEDRDGLTGDVEAQIEYAISAAALVLFVVDARDGLMPLDRRVAELLRRCRAPAVLVANKVDEPRTAAALGELNALGFGEPMSVSALHGRGRQELIEAIVERIRPLADERPTAPVLRFAIVGRRNAGKSSFINSLVGEKRVIVSEVPGTTRDSVDVRFVRNGRTYVAIDTAGVRKKSRMAGDVEYYGYVRATGAIRRADVVLFFIDATVPVGEVEKRLAGYIAEHYKPCVLVVNKWDLARGRASSDGYGEYLTKTMPMLDYAPIAFATATEAKNVQSVLDLARTLQKQADIRVETARLNDVLSQILATRGPSPKRGGRRPKIYYGTQIGTSPPTIVLFVNDPALIQPEYQRFLVNRLRERLPFDEVPIRLLFRSRRGAGQDARTDARERGSRKPRKLRQESGVGREH